MLLLLAVGAARLGGVVVEGLGRRPLSCLELAGLALWVPFMAYTEGYRGFHQAFSPRVAVRALELLERPRPLHVALAPLYCMALVHATRSRLARSWALLLGIVGLVALVRATPQPYRGIIDAGVVVGLTWGVASTALWFARALAGRTLPVSADLPE